MEQDNLIVIGSPSAISQVRQHIVNGDIVISQAATDAIKNIDSSEKALAWAIESLLGDISDFDLTLDNCNSAKNKKSYIETKESLLAKELVAIDSNKAKANPKVPP